MLFFFMACMSKTNQRLEHIEARLDQLEQQLEQPADPTPTYSPPKTQTRPPVQQDIQVDPSPGQLKIAVTGASVMVVELKCPSLRLQAKPDKQVAVFSEFTDEQCHLYFKPTPAKFGPYVPREGVLRCNISGGGAAVNCK
ncbi:MAG: hypothetical protein CMK59_06455 [Proteobacteria bacterium]|nr:hypothetical protein [Pseudomonadota bacterium]